MREAKLFKDFFESERSGGMILVLCTILSLITANSGLADTYHRFWHASIGNQSLEYWINDGLMAIFFLLVGLELKRELYIGKLSKIKDALFPTLGALGGMLLPAGLFMLVNLGTPYHAGAGIPMATDIAFAIGVLSLLGSRVPVSLKVFLTALAVIDDLGAILVIAIFYTQTLQLLNLLCALGIFGLLLVMNKYKVRNMILYLAGGLLMWYFMLHSGVHATITGILLAFTIPFGRGEKNTLSYKMQDFLHRPVTFFILPLFALANTAIPIQGSLFQALTTPYSIGIALGLIVGKPLGILLFTYTGSRLRACKRPGDLSWSTIFSVGIVAGIGFTMSIFITLLAFDDAVIIGNAKLAILLSSFIAALLGYSVLSRTLRKSTSKRKLSPVKATQS